jgi:transcriptional regulator with XRE-family HTH domain
LSQEYTPPAIVVVLKRLRKEANMTVKQLAEATCFQKSQIRDIESRWHYPGWLVVSVIARALNKSLVEIAEQVEEEERDRL